MDFQGKVVVVTGGASGMGEASARAFAKAGARVVIVDRSQERAEWVAREAGALAWVGDVSDSAFCDRAVAETLARYGRLDVLVNAAVIIVRARGEDTTDAQWNRILGVNVSGTFLCAGPPLKP